MFVKTLITALGLFGLGSAALAQEAAPEAVQRPICNLESADYVYWEALGENVVLHTKMTTPDNYLPQATLTLEMADGARVALGGGGKYYDEWAGDVPSCDEHMAAAKNETLDSLNPSYLGTMTKRHYTNWKYHSMSEIQADLRTARLCDINQLTGEAQDKCEYIQYMAERIEKNLRELPKLERDRLVSLNAPILDITYSTYGTETFVFDPNTRTLTRLFYSGC